jgi:endoglucanase
VTKSGQGTGTVTSSPAGINCGATCVATYDNGTTVTLTPTPNPGSRFQGWSGACSGKGSCLVSMTANRTVNARFR